MRTSLPAWSTVTITAFFLIFLSATISVQAAAAPATDDPAVLYTTKIQPLFESRCVSCHGAKKAKHDLRLDSMAGILKGGKELGPGVVPGKPEESAIMTVITKPKGDEQLMPPRGERLTEVQVGWIKTWIAAGAPGPK